MIPEETLAKAVCIADGAVRSDIECYAVQKKIDGGWIYSTTEAPPLRDALTEEQRRTQQFADTPADALRHLQIVRRAAEYIRERAHMFPWRMVEVEGFPGYVRFVEEATP